MERFHPKLFLRRLIPLCTQPNCFTSFKRDKYHEKLSVKLYGLFNFGGSNSSQVREHIRSQMGVYLQSQIYGLAEDKTG